jgi:hypothetical protein
MVPDQSQDAVITNHKISMEDFAKRLSPVSDAPFLLAAYGY